MQWSQIKTLFILCFLALNIYLLIQFVDKQKESDFGVLDRTTSTIEEQLKLDEIKTGDLDSEVTEASYISLLQRTFTKEDLKQLTQLPNQKPEIIHHNFIVSLFDDPVAIPEGASKDDITKIVGSNTLFPSQYEYWSWNKEMNVLIFFQLKDSRPVYFNQHGLLLVYLNDNNEIEFYTQTMLGEAENQGELKTLNRPMQAIETLYKKNKLYHKDEVTNVKMGYYTRVLSEGVQVFAPTWKVSVNEERNYFVNAIEGRVFPGNDVEFLMNTLKTNRGKVLGLDEDSKIKTTVLTLLEKKLEDSNRSEIK